MSKTSRRRAREFALQGLYQWQLAKSEPDTIAQQLAEVFDEPVDSTGPNLPK